ncbi:hypothetical protein D3C81_1150370 [compost metagenome]
MTFDIEQRMRCHANGQEQVAVGATADPRCSLALEADLLAIADPGRDLHVQGLGGEAGTLAIGVVLRDLEADLLRFRGQGFLKENRQFHFHVLPSPTAAALLAAAKRIAVATTCTEDRAEEIGKIAAFETAGTAAFPAWRALEGPAVLAVFAQFVVFSAFFRAAQGLVGFIGLFEFFLGVALFADVGVILARKLAVGGLDRLVVRSRLYAQYLVIVFEVHLRNHHKVVQCF